jgi:hypothetical protein
MRENLSLRSCDRERKKFSISIASAATRMKGDHVILGNGFSGGGHASFLFRLPIPFNDQSDEGAIITIIMRSAMEWSA